MGIQCPGIYLDHPVPWGHKYGDIALQVRGVSRIGTIKYGLKFRRTALARTRHVLSSERVLQNNIPATD
jgi:hypothetical protein